MKKLELRGSKERNVSERARCAREWPSLIHMYAHVPRPQQIKKAAFGE